MIASLNQNQAHLLTQLARHAAPRNVINFDANAQVGEDLVDELRALREAGAVFLIFDTKTEETSLAITHIGFATIKAWGE
jgi:hypothetical protein